VESARVVLVTNVGQGYGRAVALAYGRAGYDVVCADRDVDLAAKTASEVEELGGQAIPIQADMTTQMDVLSTYQKVTEIFGALGGVVHTAAQVSTTPFEELAEGEYYEMMAENVRSTFLALKAASRLLSSGWVVIIAPPAMGSVQMYAAQGALRELVYGFRRRFAYPRVNLVLPNRPPSDPRHDQALVRAVRYLGSPESAGVSGQVMDVDLPNPPRITDSLLPEVRAALDPNVRQSDDEPDEDDDEFFGDAPYNDLQSSGSDQGASQARQPFAATGTRRYPTGGAGSAWHGASEDTAAYGNNGGLGPSATAETGDAFDDDYDDHDPYDDSDYWAYDLGLPDGPALRHLVANDDPLDGDAYASGHESAKDLYGDLASLDLVEDDDDLLGSADEPRR
jgi:NAD(P)-dependent dehydrogenase (short-subunit alcohol dehydrogenase family)